MRMFIWIDWSFDLDWMVSLASESKSLLLLLLLLTSLTHFQSEGFSSPPPPFPLIFMPTPVVEPLPSILRCPVFGCAYSSQNQLDLEFHLHAHSLEQHHVERFKCPHCRKLLWTEPQLKEHQQVIIPINILILIINLIVPLTTSAFRNSESIASF